LKTAAARNSFQPLPELPKAKLRHFGGACLVAGIAVITIGVSILGGWIFRIEILKRIVPELAATNPVSAVLLILCGVALLLARIKAKLTVLRKTVAQLFAAIVAVAGALKIASLIFGWDSGVDEWLFSAQLLDPQTGIPTRMAPNTAFNFLLIGCALLLIDTRSRKGHRPAEFLATISAVSALLALLGYAYRVPNFYGVGSLLPMTLHTAIAFGVLGVGILLARSDEGIAAVIASDTAGGIVARRLLPLAILLPAGLGAFVLEAGRRGSFETDFAAVMHVATVILLFLGLIWWMARLLYRLDTERRHHEGARQENEERMREMAEHIGDVFWMTSLDGQLLFVSAAYEKVWGRPVDELYENPWQRMEAIHPMDRVRVVQSFLEESARGKYAEEYRIVRPNGEERWIADRGFPVRNKAGEVYRIAGIASDITKRKRAEEEIHEARSFLNSVVENIPHMIFIKDAKDLRFIQINHAGEKILGLSRKELIGKNDYDLFPKGEADFFASRDRAALESGMPLDIPQERVQTEGGNLTLHARKIPMLGSDGKPQYLLGIGEDITSQIEAQESIRQAKDEAERANRSKSEFLSRMSHELRTPLNAILGFGQLLELEKNLNAEQQESVRHIMSGGRHLLGLINEVLDIARIEAGRMAVSLEPVSLPDLLNDVAQLVSPLAREREIQLLQPTENQADLFAYADRQRLKQVLLNLLSNAIKYNRRGGEVRIATRCLRDETTHKVRVEVADTGVGLSAENLGQLFTPFQRLGAEKTEVEGVGLGLALSKRLVELMDGVIGVQSTPGKGSTFWVELPGAENPLEKIEPAAENVTVESSGSTSATVLYIEDNPSNLRLVERILAQRPAIHLISTAQGKAGIELAHKERPDAVLLDLNLPDMHGHEVLMKLRGHEATAQIPVIVISADATPRQVQRLKEGGAQDYLTKPIAVARFLQVLDETLKGVELAER
jgi:PAS domain S-box-containing protein